MSIEGTGEAPLTPVVKALGKGEALFVGEREVDGHQPLDSGELRSGDVITVGEPGAASASSYPVVLRIVGGERAGRLVPLPPGQWTVGREGGDVALADRSVSAQHLSVHVDPRGAVEVTDMGSSNGTDVEGARLPAGQARGVRPDEQVRLGNTVIRVGARLPQQPVESGPDSTLLFNRNVAYRRSRTAVDLTQIRE